MVLEIEIPAHVDYLEGSVPPESFLAFDQNLVHVEETLIYQATFGTDEFHDAICSGDWIRCNPNIEPAVLETLNFAASNGEEIVLMPLDTDLQKQRGILPVDAIASIGTNKSQQQIKNSIKDLSSPGKGTSSAGEGLCCPSEGLVFPGQNLSSHKGYRVLRLRGGMFFPGQSSKGLASGIQSVQLNPAVSPFMQTLHKRMNGARTTRAQATFGTSRTRLQVSRRSYLQSEYINHKTYGHAGPVQITNAFFVPAGFTFPGNERGLALSAITNHRETSDEKTLSAYLTVQNNKEGQKVANIIPANEIEEISLRAVKLLKFTRGLARYIESMPPIHVQRIVYNLVNNKDGSQLFATSLVDKKLFTKEIKKLINKQNPTWDISKLAVNDTSGNVDTYFENQKLVKDKGLHHPYQVDHKVVTEVSQILYRNDWEFGRNHQYTVFHTTDINQKLVCQAASKRKGEIIGFLNQRLYTMAVSSLNNDDVRVVFCRKYRNIEARSLIVLDLLVTRCEIEKAVTSWSQYVGISHILQLSNTFFEMNLFVVRFAKDLDFIKKKNFYNLDAAQGHTIYMHIAYISKSVLDCYSYILAGELLAERTLTKEAVTNSLDQRIVEQETQKIKKFCNSLTEELINTLDNFCESLNMLAKLKNINLNDLMLNLDFDVKILSTFNILAYKQEFLSNCNYYPESNLDTYLIDLAEGYSRIYNLNQIFKSKVMSPITGANP